MSASAVANLRACLEGLVPSHLERIAHLRSQHPGVALLPPSSVFAELAPLCQPAEVKAVFCLPQDPKDETEVRLRNLIVESSSLWLRTLVLSHTPSASPHPLTDEQLSGLVNRLDSVLSLEMHGLIDPVLPLNLLEELLDQHTIATCSQLFLYIESRVHQLTLKLTPTAGKGLSLLRLCNELLRRLSKPNQHHTVFAGRILSLLAAVFPLTERSGVNLRGDFNVDNTTIIIEGEEDGEPGLYELLWRMQRFFANPPLLMGEGESRAGTPEETDDPAPDGAKGPMAELRISSKKILAKFAEVAKREKELAGAAAAEEGARGPTQTNEITGYKPGQDYESGSKRKRHPVVKDGVRNDQVDMDDDEAETDAQSPQDNFFPKFLTGRKLLEYELRDPSFRRHILVQYLILFQYLLSFTPKEREKWKDWKNKALQALFVLGDADDKWIRSTWKDILGLLRETPPHGRVFLDAVLEVLKRESNWIRWKTESCPSIEKPPLTAEQITSFASARAHLLRAPMNYPHALGTAALSQLWEEGFPPPVPGTRRQENEMGEYVDVPTDGLEELEFPPPVPSLHDYHRLIKREEAKSKQSGDDAAAVEKRQSLAWRALRVASAEHLHLFKEMKGPENIDLLMKAIEEADKPSKKVKLEEEEEEEEAVAVPRQEGKKEEAEVPKAEETAPLKVEEDAKEEKAPPAVDEPSKEEEEEEEEVEPAKEAEQPKEAEEVTAMEE